MSTPSAVMTPGGLSAPGRAKFIIGFGVIIAAIVYLVASNTLTKNQFFFTVQELQEKGTSFVGRPVRVSGAVIGESIKYDAQTLTLSFTIANVTNDLKEIDAHGGLAQVLSEAVADPAAPRLAVIYIGPKPDLMKPEAQAIVEGRLGADGVFHATDLLLKCPTRYEEQVPAQSD